METRDDAELVKRAGGGESAAYRALVEKYEKRVYNLAFEVLKNKEDAEDVAQESFVKAYLSLRDFKGRSSFYTWLYRIVYNMAIDFRRKLIRRGVDNVQFNETNLHAAPALDSYPSSPDAVVLGKEQGREIRRALDSLSEEHRAVIMLREIEGLSYKDIARITGVSRGTVMSRLHYARKRLKHALAWAGEKGQAREGGDESGHSGNCRPLKRPGGPAESLRAEAESASAAVGSAGCQKSKKKQLVREAENGKERRVEWAA